MVKFIDEWRRKFPSCMVVKRLIDPVNNQLFAIFMVYMRNYKNTYVL